jgi:hypothetical protein
MPVIHFIIVMYLYWTCRHWIEPMEWNTQRLCNYVRNTATYDRWRVLQSSPSVICGMHVNIRYAGLACSLPAIKHVISNRQVVVMGRVPFISVLSLLKGCVKDKSNKSVIILTRLSGVLHYLIKQSEPYFTFLPVFKCCWEEIVETTWENWR